MFRTACNNGGITLWGWPEFPLPGNGSRVVCILAVTCGAALLEGGGAQYCVHSSLCCWQSGASVNLIPYPPTWSQSNGLAHRVGTRDIVWQLTTLSVHLYDPCTLSSRGFEGSRAAGNLQDLSLPPFPLSISLRFSLPVSAWATYTAGRKAGSGK